MSAKALQFVVGKGGVGKSTVAAALAIGAAKPGRRVLAVEFGSAGGLARALGVDAPVSDAPNEVRPGLYLTRIEGEIALAEYLELVVPIRRLLATVLASRIYRYFVAAAPGLKELMTMGKVWYEFQKTRDGGGRLWDSIVVDAGASGHSLQYLQMPSTAVKTFGSGLVHREATRVEGLLKNAATTAVHVVATPEDMPLTEARHIVERLRGDLGLPVGLLFVNRVRPSSPPGAREAVARLAETSDADSELQSHFGCDGDLVRQSIAVAATRALAWEEIQERGVARLESALDLRAARIPLLVADEFGHAELERLAAIVEAMFEVDR